MERYCLTAAKEMLDLEELPQLLRNKLVQAEKMVHKAKPGGFLTSTQTIASIILLWELEVAIQKAIKDE